MELLTTPQSRITVIVSVSVICGVSDAANIHPSNSVRHVEAVFSICMSQHEQAWHAVGQT